MHGAVIWFPGLWVVLDELEFHHIVIQMPSMKNALRDFCHSAPWSHFTFEANFTDDVYEDFHPSSRHISGQCSHFIPRENIRKSKVLIRKPKVFWCFQGVWNGKIIQKWVKLICTLTLTLNSQQSNLSIHISNSKELYIVT